MERQEDAGATVIKPGWKGLLLLASWRRSSLPVLGGELAISAGP
jgi:hypothetical protein